MHGQAQQGSVVEVQRVVAGDICVVMGKPAVGKTVAVATLDDLGFRHLNSRETVERVAGKRDDLETIRKEGGLWGDHLVNRIVFNDMAKNRDKKHGLDGFPRSIGQASRLIGYCRATDAGLTVVEIQAPDQTTIDRVAERRAECVRLGIPIRDDDKEEVHLDRLRRYGQYGPIVIEYFKSMGVAVHAVDGTHGKEVVSEAIRRIVHKSA